MGWSLRPSLPLRVQLRYWVLLLRASRTRDSQPWVAIARPVLPPEIIPTARPSSRSAQSGHRVRPVRDVLEGPVLRARQSSQVYAMTAPYLLA